MTTITIKNGNLKKTSFEDNKDLFHFLLDSFADETVLVKTTLKDLNTTENEAWKQHKQDGYADFVNL